MNLISPADLERIEATLAHRLPTPRDDGGGDDATLDFFHQALRRFVLAGGKRIRPQLCLWTYRGLAGSAYPPADAVLQIACGWELFHAFLLVHDDIIDQADTRRDLPSLHRDLEALGDVSAKLGADLAVVAGDLLFSVAMNTFHEVDLPPALYRRQLRLFSRVAMTTGLGQALDIAQAATPLADACERRLLREYHWKTAAYTFEGPMLSGAVLAGADEHVQKTLSRYALSLGQAYQLQNDLIDLATPAHEGCDLIQGKRTVTLLRARSAMGESQRRRFDSILVELPGANGQAVALAEDLRQELLATGAPDRTRELIHDFLADATYAADDRAIPSTLSTGLHGLLTKLRQQYFT